MTSGPFSSLCLLLVPTLLPGQAFATTPPGIDSREGSDAAYIFAWAADQKHRFIDGSYRGAPRATKAVAFRPDYRNHKAIGRTWAKVRLLAGHADYRSIQYNKSTAYTQIGTPTTVFDRKWSFPALNGFPLRQPADWGGPQSALSFRFTNPFIQDGKNALFLEFQFSGGTADKGQPWLGTTPKGFEYHLDSMTQDEWRRGPLKTLPAKPGFCVDSFYGTKKLPVQISASLSGTTVAELRLSSLYTAPLRPLIYGLSRQTNTVGLDLGAACQRLHLGPHALLLPQAAPNNASGARTLTLRAPMQTWMKDLWIQVGWADSSSRQLRLSHAQQVGSGGEIPFVVSYQVGSFQVWTASPKGTPFIRYQL